MSKALANPTYTPIPHPDKPFRTFQEFYPFYLGEHTNRINRTFHLVGTGSFLAFTIRAVVGYTSLQLLRSDFRPSASLGEAGLFLESLRLSGRDTLRTLLSAVVTAYFLAWLGHFGVEKNRPATFKYPLFSLRGDFTMLWEVLTFQRKP